MVETLISFFFFPPEFAIQTCGPNTRGSAINLKMHVIRTQCFCTLIYTQQDINSTSSVVLPWTLPGRAGIWQ